MRNTVPANDVEVTLAAKACRHLLRHLDEPLHACTNPLVAAHFARAPTLQDVRGLLAAMGESLPKRDREILQRCDLRSQPHKLVARAMGLSMRHFYRERGAMIDRLAMQLFAGREYVVTKTSRYAYTRSLERVRSAILNAGNIIFAVIDRGERTLFLFGDPKGGTPLMDAEPLIALELPLKILVWQDERDVRVAFTPMTEIAARYGISGMETRIAAMDKALNDIAGAVV